MITTANDFRAWLAQAAHGARCCYGRDIICDKDGKRTEVADEAWRAYEAGLVSLVQARRDGDLVYLAERRHTPIASKRRRRAA